MRVIMSVIVITLDKGDREGDRDYPEDEDAQCDSQCDRGRR